LSRAVLEDLLPLVDTRHDGRHDNEDCCKYSSGILDQSLSG